MAYFLQQKEKRKILKLMRSEKYFDAEIARMYGRSETTIYRLRRKYINRPAKKTI